MASWARFLSLSHSYVLTIVIFFFVSFILLPWLMNICIGGSQREAAHAVEH